MNVAMPAASLMAAKLRDKTTVGAASSFNMVPVAEAVVNVVPALGPDNVTLKLSSSSIVVSAATLTVITLLDSPELKVTLPVVTKMSAALIGLGVVPVTVKFADETAVKSPLRETVNVYGVLPLLPSALSADVATIAKLVLT